MPAFPEILLARKPLQARIDRLMQRRPPHARRRKRSALGRRRARHIWWPTRVTSGAREIARSKIAATLWRKNARVMKRAAPRSSRRQLRRFVRFASARAGADPALLDDLKMRGPRLGFASLAALLGAPGFLEIGVERRLDLRRRGRRLGKRRGGILRNGE